MGHHRQIKEALGISGIATTVSTWRSNPDPPKNLPGAQIDMIIERADRVIHLCEMKFSQKAYNITFLRGMSFIDMTYLKKTNLKNGSTVYRRHNIGQQLTIGWTPEMQLLIDKYLDNPTKYLLPIIKTVGCNERCSYRNAGYNINHSLKKIAEIVGIEVRYHSYKERLMQSLKAGRCKGLLKQTYELRIWIKSKL